MLETYEYYHKKIVMNGYLYIFFFSYFLSTVICIPFTNALIEDTNRSQGKCHSKKISTCSVFCFCRT